VSNPLVGEVKLAQILAALKRVGYKEVWINTTHPCWNHWPMGVIVARPRQWNRDHRSGDWPSLWHLPLPWLEMACGNGLNDADQAQFRGIDDIPAGHYNLETYYE